MSPRLPLLMLAVAGLLAGCNSLPTSGPSTRAVENAGATDPTIQLVLVDDAIARRLLSQKQQRLFSETLSGPVETDAPMGAGDVLEVSIWEAPPATLFGSGVAADVRGAPSSSRPTTLPEQTVDRTGTVNVPFAGKVPAAGRTTVLMMSLT